MNEVNLIGLTGRLGINARLYIGLFDCTKPRLTCHELVSKLWWFYKEIIITGKPVTLRLIHICNRYFTVLALLYYTWVAFKTFMLVLCLKLAFDFTALVLRFKAFNRLKVFPFFVINSALNSVNLVSLRGQCIRSRAIFRFFIWTSALSYLILKRAHFHAQAAGPRLLSTNIVLRGSCG